MNIGVPFKDPYIKMVSAIVRLVKRCENEKYLTLDTAGKTCLCICYYFIAIRMSNIHFWKPPVVSKCCSLSSDRRESPFLLQCVQASFHWLRMKTPIDFKILPIHKDLRGRAPPYLEKLTYRSTARMLVYLCFPGSLKVERLRAFSHQALRLI